MTQVPGDKTRDIELQPGERRAANGVVIGSGAEPGTPRFGADDTGAGDRWEDPRDTFGGETDNDYADETPE